ncbi:MAG: hypothetical protein DI562_04645 [Stenotrophomonas acidaminiphila]|nr:MAG: hypothetical protein DI562_04645 [Stenotrophomonas acidaminiphila]
MAQGIAQRAAKGLGTDPVSVFDAFRELKAAGLVSYSADTMGVPYAGYLIVTAEQISVSEAAAAWQAALTLEEVDPELARVLAPCHAIFEDLDTSDMRLAIRGLLRVRETSEASAGDFGFCVSAREILGSSKVLARLPIAALKLLGIDRLPATPRYVVVAGPAEPAAVLLIENTTSFEMAVRAGLDRELALVAAYGYGLNIHSDSSAGLALLDSVTIGRCEVLSRSGQGHALPRLLAHPKLFFWGDLDREGLRIALALKQRLPHLSLSALYAPMCALAKEHKTSHPYVAMSGKALQSSWVRTGDELMDELARSCELRAVDQEALDVARHMNLGARAFDGAPA